VCNIDGDAVDVGGSVCEIVEVDEWECVRVVIA
jgi:hypothetical protein